MVKVKISGNCISINKEVDFYIVIVGKIIYTYSKLFGDNFFVFPPGLPPTNCRYKKNEFFRMVTRKAKN